MLGLGEAAVVPNGPRQPKGLVCCANVKCSQAEGDTGTPHPRALGVVEAHECNCFDGASPSLQLVVGRIVTEGKAWQQASLLKGEVDSMPELLVGWVGSE